MKQMVFNVLQSVYLPIADEKLKVSEGTVLYFAVLNLTLLKCRSGYRVNENNRNIEQIEKILAERRTTQSYAKCDRFTDVHSEDHCLG